MSTSTVEINSFASVDAPGSNEIWLEEGTPPVDPADQFPKPYRRRKRWRFRLRPSGSGNDPGVAERAKRLKGLSISCSCSSAIRGSCLIILASFIELIGCLMGLIYGICYIQSACSFYELGNDSEAPEEEYDAMLERILFLEKTRVGFVGLLATCIVGMFISFLMPAGTIYKSWKCLRAAMTLLFTVSMVHLLLVCIYLPNHILVASLAAIPFRAFECYLILKYIKYYKRRKLEELRERMKLAGGNIFAMDEAAGTSLKMVAACSSTCTCDHAPIQRQSKPDAPASNDAQTRGSILAQTSVSQENENSKATPDADLIPKHKKHKHKRKVQNNPNKEEHVQRKSSKYESYMAYDMIK